jgi:hypothetical protein
MSNKVINYVLENSETKSSCRLLMVVIADMSNDDGECDPGTARLAQKVNCIERNVQKLVDRCESMGELAVIENGGRKTISGWTNKYVVLGPHYQTWRDVPGAREPKPLVDEDTSESTPRNKGMSKKTPHDTSKKTPHDTSKKTPKPLAKPLANPNNINSPDGVAFASVLNFNDVKEHWNRKEQVWAFPEMVYIGRTNKSKNLPASIWANPFAISAKVPRDEALRRYRLYVLTSPELVAALPELIGKTKICWCAPEACHGHVLDELLEAYQAGTLSQMVAVAEKTMRNRQPVIEAVAIHIFNIPDPKRIPEGDGSVIGSFEKAVHKNFSQQFGIYNHALATRSVERFAQWMRLNKRSLPRYVGGFEPDYIAFLQQKDSEIRAHLQADGTPAITEPLPQQARSNGTQPVPTPAVPAGHLIDPAKLRARFGGQNGR